MEIKINYSRNRVKTISAKMIKEVMHIYAPAGISAEELQKVTANFKKRFERKQLKAELNKDPERLPALARELNNKYFGGKLEIKQIEYSAAQDKKYGVCHYPEKVIRISHRLSAMPDWVRNYVIVHELAHLIEPNHSSRFWELVNRYRLAERARGYLIAKGLEDMEPETKEDEVETGE